MTVWESSHWELFSGKQQGKGATGETAEVLLQNQQWLQAFLEGSWYFPPQAQSFIMLSD